MPRNTKKQPIYCLQHQFSLTPLKTDVYFKQITSLSYCKGRVQSKIHKKCNNGDNADGNCSCCPIYNKDKNYATSSFILPEQQQNFMENSKKLKLQHQHRVFDYNDQKSKMLIPKPKTKYSYCSACRTNYEDYLQHIRMDSHKNCAGKSRFSHYIKDLQRKYQKKIKVSILAAKSFQGVSTNNQSHAEICGEELGRPNKKVKLTHEQPQNIQPQPSKSILSQSISLNSINPFQLPYQMPLSFPMPAMPAMPNAAPITANPNIFYPPPYPSSYSPYGQIQLANILHNNPYLYWNNSYGFNPALLNMNLNMNMNMNLNNNNNHSNNNNNQNQLPYININSLNNLDAYLNLNLNINLNNHHQAGYQHIGMSNNRPIVIDLQQQNQA